MIRNKCTWGRAWSACHTGRGAMIQKTGEKERHKPGYETLDNGDGGGR